MDPCFLIQNNQHFKHINIYLNSYKHFQNTACIIACLQTYIGVFQNNQHREGPPNRWGQHGPIGMFAIPREVIHRVPKVQSTIEAGLD